MRSTFDLEFLRVSGDSRCPAGFFCIQVGDAIVQLRATSGGSIDYELHTGDQARTVVSHGPIRIELVQLQPYPFPSTPPTPLERPRRKREQGRHLRVDLVRAVKGRSSRRSHARAKAHSRSIVAGDTRRVLAVSSIVRPARYRNSMI
jgi:hypothetical protein